MTEERSGSSSALYVRKRVSAHFKRREDECIVILARAYIDVATKLNGDVSEVFRLFNEFTTTVVKAPVPQRRRGKADPEYDARILAVGDAAPRGRKEAAIAAEAGAQTASEIDTARKRYDQLRAKRDAHEKWLAEVVAAVRRKLGHRSPQPLFKNTVPAPP
jgi:hypothetical protein